eukprot:TRINITY_DN16744_c2_g1_i1.p1 TRINITY_DN16744_c2_g1~~TRINITY_DN16744_c2_g1_i1.p1  ORF type:complete len:451 (+),score=68.96 TRINITY_DN16744_c2_g1_i1:89-1354(+)
MSVFLRRACLLRPGPLLRSRQITCSAFPQHVRLPYHSDLCRGRSKSSEAVPCRQNPLASSSRTTSLAGSPPARDICELVKEAGGDENCVEMLNELGVKESSDLRFLTDEDMVKKGIPLVLARKLFLDVHTESRTLSPMKSEETRAAKISGFFDAEETMRSLAMKGLSSGERTAPQVLCSSFLGGSYLAWGCALTTVVAGGSSIFLADAPGLLSLLTGAVFPVGLTMVLLNGSELLTGNFMTLALPAWTHPCLGISEVIARKWRIVWMSFLGNFAGSLLVACGIYSLSVVQVGSPAAAWVATLAAKKCSLSLPVAVGKGMGANWLVNVGIFQAASAHTSAGKIAGLWLPVMTFVSLGLEHSVANMFLLPLGYFFGADVSMLDIAMNIGPVAVGNALGAIIFVSGLQRYAILKNSVLPRTVSK